MHCEDSLQGCPISAEKQQCVSREVCTRGGVSSIITLAPSSFRTFSLSGGRGEEKQNDSGQPIPDVSRDCIGSDGTVTIIAQFFCFFFPCTFVCTCLN